MVFFTVPLGAHSTLHRHCLFTKAKAYLRGIIYTATFLLRKSVFYAGMLTRISSHFLMEATMYKLLSTIVLLTQLTTLSYGKEISIDAKNPWRVEAFTGYKTSMNYFKDEQDNCRESCTFDATGSVVGADIYRNIKGDTRSDNYSDLGFQYLSIPVGSWRNDKTLRGTAGTVINPGSGGLRYHFLRFNIKKSNFLNVIKHKYLISSFGIGMAVPDSQGTGKQFVGANRIHPSIGGKLGMQYPLTRSLDVGIASAWSVLWFGNSFKDSAFISGYGINLSWRV